MTPKQKAAHDKRQSDLIADLADLVRTAHTRIDSIVTPQNTAPADKSKEVSALVGLWIERHKAEGAMTVDLKRVDDVRAGIELALS